MDNLEKDLNSNLYSILQILGATDIGSIPIFPHRSSDSKKLYKCCKKTSNIYVCEMYYNILYCGRDCREKSVELPSLEGAVKQKTMNL